MNIKFFMPTKVIIGKDCIKENADLLKQFGSKALIVTGKQSAKINGSLKDIEDALIINNIAYVIYDKIEANPSIATVRDAAEIGKKERVDFIIGIGGGSPLDAAKAIAILCTNDIDNSELFKGVYKKSVLPIIAVPTTAGTGSEVTQYSILTDASISSKNSIASESIFPRLAFLDATYTEKLPLEVTINTAIDALSHSFEGYLSNRASALSNVLSIESIKTLGAILKTLNQKPDFEDREKLLYASMLGGMVIANTGTTALHAIGYSLTYFKNIDHGRANGLLMYEYLKYLSTRFEDKILKLLSAIGLQNLEDFKTLLDGLLKDKETISDEEIKLFCSLAIKTKNIGNTLIKPLEEDLKNILKNSF